MIKKNCPAQPDGQAGLFLPNVTDWGLWRNSLRLSMLPQFYHELDESAKIMNNLEAVYDRLPNIRVLSLNDEGIRFEADVFEQGIRMWLLSQGTQIEVLIMLKC